MKSEDIAQVISILIVVAAFTVLTCSFVQCTVKYNSEEHQIELAKAARPCK
jgi:hypothetical protein